MIEDLPQRMRELGRLRMGEKAISGKSGKSYPVKRTTWRFTGADAGLLGVIGDLYGGDVEPWTEAPGEGTFYQIKTEANSVDVLIPVAHALSQFYEFWTADGCTRRCTGKVNLIDDSPCVCPSDISARMEAASGLKPTACKPTTRLNVMLPNVPDLGYWRVEAHGYQAAIELPGMLAQYVGLARMHAGPGANLDDLLLRAELAIDSRRVKKPGQPPADFVVPVIRTPGVTPAMLMTGEAPGLASVSNLQIDAGSPSLPALGAGVERPGTAHSDAASPAAPPPFDSSNEKIVDRDTALALKTEASAGGIAGKALADVVAGATGGSVNVLTKVLKEDWAKVETAVYAAMERVVEQRAGVA